MNGGARDTSVIRLLDDVDNEALNGRTEGFPILNHDTNQTHFHQYDPSTRKGGGFGMAFGKRFHGNSDRSDGGGKYSGYSTLAEPDENDSGSDDEEDDDEIEIIQEQQAMLPLNSTIRSKSEPQSTSLIEYGDKESEDVASGHVLGFWRRSARHPKEERRKRGQNMQLQQLNDEKDDDSNHDNNDFNDSHNAHGGSDSSSDGNNVEQDDQVETTIQPVPLLYRNFNAQNIGNGGNIMPDTYSDSELTGAGNVYSSAGNGGGWGGLFRRRENMQQSGERRWRWGEKELEHDISENRGPPPFLRPFVGFGQRLQQEIIQNPPIKHSQVQPQSCLSPSISHENSMEEDRHEYVLYSAPDYDPNDDSDCDHDDNGLNTSGKYSNPMDVQIDRGEGSLLSHNVDADRCGNNEEDGTFGYSMPTPVPTSPQNLLEPPDSPLRFNFRRNRLAMENGNHNNNNGMFSRNERRGEGFLSLPIVRPFLIGSRRGFSDNVDNVSNNESTSPNNLSNNNSETSIPNMIDGEDANDPAAETTNATDAISRNDRVNMIQSISEGIRGTNNDSLLLPVSSHSSIGSFGSNHLDTSSKSNREAPLWGKILFPRFFQGMQPNTDIHNSNRNRRDVRNFRRVTKNTMIEFHSLLRKEDWSLATQFLQSHHQARQIARTWHPIQRLYAGRYNGDALPLHAACALNPPASFIQLLIQLYPEGLLEKEKGFGRVPLHVACRSMASVDVIRLLCEEEPKSVLERDTLKRVPLHYLIKNYSAFGEDANEGENEKKVEESGDDNDSESEDQRSKSNDFGASSILSEDEKSNDNSISPDHDKADNAVSVDEESSCEGFTALCILIQTNSECVRASDHRGWIPLHVACSSSSRRGMIRVIQFLLQVWPESILVKTQKGSDVFGCVEMVGRVHPEKEMVNEMLELAKKKVLESKNEVGSSDREENQIDMVKVENNEEQKEEEDSDDSQVNDEESSEDEIEDVSARDGSNGSDGESKEVSEEDSSDDDYSSNDHEDCSSSTRDSHPVTNDDRNASALIPIE